MINIGKNRECFFDNFLIDTEKTTAQTKIHKPVRRELAFSHDAEWEGCGSNFHNFFYDEEFGKYRMYYLGWAMSEYGKTKDGIRACYMESEDGKNWVRPNLGIVEYNGSKNNNIITNTELLKRLDNFMVFKDTNPACPKEEKYKAVLRAVCEGEDHTQRVCRFCLKFLVSPDGINFTEGGIICDQGAFDSLNVCFWDDFAKLYRCYYRWNHKVGDKTVNAGMGTEVRDIRYTESADFKTWTEPKLIDFGESEDIPLYTNVAQNYYRAPQYIIGFPTRYIEREGWTESYEVLCGKEKRQKRMTEEARYGLTVTDCIFMASRDGLNFTKYDEAIMTPGPEVATNWVYGDCYPARGMIETPSAICGADPEISIFAGDNHWQGFEYSTDMYRYTFRLDGFVSRHAGGSEEELTTKPFVYDGSTMYANIETSARGYIYFTLESADGESISSCEMFGDSVDKKIGFAAGDVARFSGKEVVLKLRMFDADIYSFRFE